MTHQYERNSPDNSILFDPTRTSDDQSVDDMTDDLLSQLEDGTEMGKITRERDLYRSNLSTILANLFIVSRLPGEVYVAYSRNENSSMYRVSSVYNRNRLSYTRTITLVDGLADLGLIDKLPGFNDRRRGVGRMSRMIPTDDLKLLLDSDHYGLTPDMFHRDMELIVLKDRQKQYIHNYQDNRPIRQMRTNLERINQALSVLVITPGPRQSLPRDTTLYRVFNNVTPSRRNTNQGGRFYGHWIQGLSSEERAKLKINGKPVIELDYAGLQVNMLYALDGLPLPEGDVYDLDDVLPEREIRKVVLQCMLNATSRQGAIRAVLDECRDRGQRDPRYSFIDSEEIKEAVEAFSSIHTPIQDHLFRGTGPFLQRKDSEMVELVMLDMLDQGTPCIPIHDSFLVPEDQEHELRKAMNRASVTVVGVTLQVKRGWTKGFMEGHPFP